MKEVMKAIYAPINNAHTHRTYRTQASEKAVYPYVVYKLLPIANTEQDRDDYTLEVSCWDKPDNGSDDHIIGVADAVKQSLERCRVINDHVLVIVTRPNVGYVPDSDSQVKRYDVTATLKTYRR